MAKPRLSDLPSIKQLRDALAYDAETGVLTWKPQPPRRGVRNIAGKEAGWVQNGYRQLTIGQVTVFSHRVAWALVHGQWPAEFVDHVNMDRTDNRLVNLRLATKSENSCNTRARVNNASGMKGVYLCRSTGRWRARIMLGGKSTCLGRFNTAEAAHEAYRKAAEQVHGEFARAC